jgi:putative endonuclease
MDKRKRGNFAEDYACELLGRNGYKIIERNFYTTFSEIDIIALKDDFLILVEVKARWGTRFGMPEEAVNEKKLFRIKKAGELYYKNNKNLPKKMRVDVVSLILEKSNIVSEKIIKVF